MDKVFILTAIEDGVEVCDSTLSGILFLSCWLLYSILLLLVHTMSTFLCHELCMDEHKSEEEWLVGIVYDNDRFGSCEGLHWSLPLRIWTTWYFLLIVVTWYTVLWSIQCIVCQSSMFCQTKWIHRCTTNLCPAICAVLILSFLFLSPETPKHLLAASECTEELLWYFMFCYMQLGLITVFYTL